MWCVLSMVIGMFWWVSKYVVVRLVMLVLMMYILMCRLVCRVLNCGSLLLVYVVWCSFLFMEFFMLWMFWLLGLGWEG